MIFQNISELGKAVRSAMLFDKSLLWGSTTGVVALTISGGSQKLAGGFHLT